MYCMKVIIFAGGASDDCAKVRMKIPYSVTLELPGDEYVISTPNQICTILNIELLGTSLSSQPIESKELERSFGTFSDCWLEQLMLNLWELTNGMKEKLTGTRR